MNYRTRTLLGALLGMIIFVLAAVLLMGLVKVTTLTALFNINQHRVESYQYQFITGDEAISLFNETLLRAQKDSPDSPEFISIKLSYDRSITLESDSIFFDNSDIRINKVYRVFKSRGDFLKYYMHLKKASKVYFRYPSLIKQASGT